MLDGLLGRGFSSKCKSCIKQIKARIDEIRRRRNAMQKFLKKDISDLLKNGLDINAYGRAGGLLIELSLSSCYELVEEFCGSIPRHLSVMQKQSECPEECREAVSSLMFAAARFADLPELRELRQMFTEKYGNSLDIFKNQEFVEKLAANPPTVDSKLQLMRDIAKESSIKWDSKAFEQKLSNPSAPAQDRPKRHTSLQDRHTVVNKPHSSKDDSALKRDAQDILPRGRREPTDDGFKPHGREENVLKRDKEDASSRGRELTNDGYRASNGKHETTPRKDNVDVLPRGKGEVADDEIKPRKAREVTAMKSDNQEVSSRGRRGYIVDEYQPHNVVVEKTVVQRENHNVLSHGRKEYIQDPYKHRDETFLKRDNQEVSSRGRRDLNDEGGEVSSRGRRGYIVDEYQPHNVVVEKTVVQRENHNVPSHGRKEYIQDPYKHRDETFLKRDNQEVSSRGRRDLNDEGGEAIQKRDNWEVLSRKRHDVTANGFKLHNGSKDSARETDNLDYASHGRIEEADDGYRLHGGRKNAVHRRIHQADSSHGKQELDALPHAGNTHNVRTGHAGFREKAFEEAESIKPHYNNMIPPPYVRPNDGKHSTRHATSDSNKAAHDTPIYDRDPNDRSERIHKEPNQERHEFGPARVHGHGDENSHHHRHEDDLGGDRKPKPKSVRRRHLKPPPGHEYIANSNNEGVDLKSNPSDRGRGDARRGLQHALSDDQPPKDEAEKMMDQLLMHYSKKPSKFEEVRVRAGLNPPPGRHDVSERKQGRGHLNMDSTHPPARARSLPQEPVTPTDSRRGPARAASFEPDMNQAGHVHPKLPDCDDLEARFASLRAR